MHTVLRYTWIDERPHRRGTIPLLLLENERGTTAPGRRWTRHGGSLDPSGPELRRGEGDSLRLLRRTRVGQMRVNRSSRGADDVSAV